MASNSFIEAVDGYKRKALTQSSARLDQSRQALMKWAVDLAFACASIIDCQAHISRYMAAIRFNNEGTFVINGPIAVVDEARIAL